MSDAPAWAPRALRAEHAAYYVGLSPTTFHAIVAPSVPPVRLTAGRVAWLREDLDRWLDARRASPDAAQAEAIPHDDEDPIRAGLRNLATQRRARRQDAPR